MAFVLRAGGPRSRDKLRAPGAREKKQLLREMIASKKVAFSVVGDIAKAHRRYRHQSKEHGFLGCQVNLDEEVPGDPAAQTVYVNLVGTFGISCASYWWSRIAVRGLRLTHHLLGPEYPIDMLFYADDLESLGCGAKGRQGIPLSYLYFASLGYPFKWAKSRGGFRVEWLGMETEYSSFRLGLSAKRALWRVSWLRQTVETGYITAKEMAQGLGRLGFAAMSLDWEKPFLGPLYAWSSAVQGCQGPLKVPTILRVLGSRIADRLEKGDRLQRPVQAEEGQAWIGGFF